MGFRYPSHWLELGDMAFDPSLIEHDKHGFAMDFIARQEDRDRYLEDYLDNLPAPSGGGKRYATVVVAASNSDHHASADADYVCTGTNDHVTIQSAVNAVNASSPTYGVVLLMEGTYNFGTTLTSGAMLQMFGCDLVGQGTQGTHIVVPTSAPACTVISGVNRCAHLTVTNAGATANAITFVEGGTFEDVQVVPGFASGAGSIGILADISNQNPLVKSCLVSRCDINYKLAGNMTAIGNTSQSLAGAVTSKHYWLTFGYNILAFNAAMSGNTGGQGIWVDGHDNIVVGNLVDECAPGAPQVVLSPTAVRSNVQMNTVRKETGGTATYGIEVQAGATDNFVTNNDLKGSGATASLHDLGTGTITVAGNRL